MRVFVDVGAHYGQTLEVVLDPAWGFDQVFILEPASACHVLLRRFRDPRLRLHPIALGSRTGTTKLYGAGLLGGSLFPSKRQKASSDQITTEQIRMVRASDWFKSSIPAGADVFMKFNCEGAECDIIDDLLSAGLAPRLTNLYVDFDVRKVDGLGHRQAEVEKRLEQMGVRFVTSDTLGCGANEAVAKWLAMECPRVVARRGDALRFHLGLHVPLYLQLKLLARKLLPKRLYFWLGHRFGRLARAG